MTATISNSRHSALDVIKGLAIILVVVGHLVQHTLIVEQQNFFYHPAYQFIYMFHMPLFFVISGFLLVESLLRYKVNELLIKRVWSIGLPYLIWGVMGALVSSVVFKLNPAQAILDQLVLHPAIWFLWTLFACSCLIIILSCLGRPLFIPMIVVTMIALWVIPTSTYGAFYHIKWFFPFMVLGFLVRHFNLNFPKIGRAVLMVVGIGILGAMTPYWSMQDYIYNNYMMPESSGLDASIKSYGVRYGIAIVGIITTAIMATFIKAKRLQEILIELGKYSLGIYLVQRYLVEGIYEKAYRLSGLNFNGESLFFNLVVLPLLTLVFITCCYLITVKGIARFRFTNLIFLGGR